MHSSRRERTSRRAEVTSRRAADDLWDRARALPLAHAQLSARATLVSAVGNGGGDRPALSHGVISEPTWVLPKDGIVRPLNALLEKRRRVIGVRCEADGHRSLHRPPTEEASRIPQGVFLFPPECPAPRPSSRPLARPPGPARPSPARVAPDPSAPVRAAAPRAHPPTPPRPPRSPPGSPATPRRSRSTAHG